MAQRKNSGGEEATRQHYRLATGQPVNGGSASKPEPKGFSKGARVSPPKRG
jgi:hypothetical protein